MTLGVFNGTHRMKGNTHAGCCTRVFVPCGCFIICHSSLLQYGDKSLVDDGRIATSLRAFGYIVENDYEVTIPIVTHQLYKVNACDSKACPICPKMSKILSPVVDEYNIWRAHLTKSLSVGDVVLGNLESLGWAVGVGMDLHYALVQSDLLKIRLPSNTKNWRYIQGVTKFQFANLKR